ncbi:MAG: hypothetical protein NZ765_09750 [Anaerolineae bacterium]|nr:hypothetical protein [Anaerolineae bacterium]
MVHNGGMDPIESIARAIATFEGFFKLGSRAQRNNNPGNLRYAGQPGAIGADAAGYAVFPNAEAGWEALRRQIRLDASRGLTLEQFIRKYAPPNENPTEAYLRFVSQRTGLAPGDRLPFAQTPLAVAGGEDLWCEGDEPCWWYYRTSARSEEWGPLVAFGVGLVALLVVLS